MSGLIGDRLYEELFTELSWVKTAISELSDTLHRDSYTISLLRNRVEPEDAQALEKVIFLTGRTIASMPFAEVRAKVVKEFSADTGKEWGLADNILQEILELKLSELGIH